MYSPLWRITHQNPSVLCTSPLWKITHQTPLVSCTPPFEESPIKTHRFCILPPLKNHPSKAIGFVYSPLGKSLFWWALISGRAFISTDTVSVCVFVGNNPGLAERGFGQDSLRGQAGPDCGISAQRTPEESAGKRSLLLRVFYVIRQEKNHLDVYFWIISAFKIACFVLIRLDVPEPSHSWTCPTAPWSDGRRLAEAAPIGRKWSVNGSPAFANKPDPWWTPWSMPAKWSRYSLAAIMACELRQ